MENDKIESPENDSNNTESKPIKEKKKMSNKKFTIICVPIVLLVCVLAVAGTVLIFNAMQPEPKTLLGSSVNFEALVERVEKEPSKKVEDIFKDDQYNMANYAIAKFAKNEYALTIGKGTSSSDSVLQTIDMATIVTPDEVFNQNVSVTEKAPLGVSVNTALRVYDKKDEKVDFYALKNPSDWKDGAGKEVTYTEYIDLYGKLLVPSYTVKIEGEDKFSYLENSDNVEKGQSFEVNSVFDYNFNEESINAFEYEVTASGYTLTIALDPTYACIFYSKKVQTNGGLTKKPEFTALVDVKMNLDKDFNLLSSSSKEVYKAVLGITQTMTGIMECDYVFASNKTDFKYNGKDINIPTIDADLGLNKETK